MITSIAFFSLFAKNFANNLETQPTRLIVLKSTSSTGLELLGIRVKNVALVPYSAFPYYGILKAYQVSQPALHPMSLEEKSISLIEY